MESEKSSYKELAKTNLVFGGVKIFQVLIQILKTKIVALLLGPSGMGIQSLLVSTITTIYQFGSLGITQSSVREISIEHDVSKKKLIVKSVNYLSVSLGAIISVLCFIFSSQLSLLVFGENGNKWMFMVVSASLFFNSISNAQIAILQGLRYIQILAKSSLLVSIITLILSIPIYYIGRISAIPYVIVLGYSISAIIIYLWRYKKFKANEKLSFDEFKLSSSSILSLGITLMLSNSIMSLFNLGLNMFINRIGSSADVGLFNAANISTYSAINILVAVLASDYYPRLSATINDRNKTSVLVGNQIELLLLVLTPIIYFMVLFPQIFVKVLYSSDFLSVTSAIQVMAISLYFRVVWHSFSYVILAKGDKKTYLLVDAIIGNGLFFLGNMIGFYFNQIDGVAFSYLIMSSIVMISLFIVCKEKYKMLFNKSTYFVFVVLLILCLAILFINTVSFSKIFLILFKVILTTTMISYVLFQLDHRLMIVVYIKKKLCRKK